MAFAVTLLPKGFKSDLSLIGQGSPSVVLVHDKNLVNSVTMMELLNEVRSDYEGDIVFLAVDIATPKGQSFSQQQRARPVDLVIFGPHGKKQQVLDANLNEQELRSILDDTLNKA